MVAERPNRLRVSAVLRIMHSYTVTDARVIRVDNLGQYACDDVNQVHARVDSGALRWAPQAGIGGLAYDGTAPGRQSEQTGAAAGVLFPFDRGVDVF
jgi:hypothetical protein